MRFDLIFCVKIFKFEKKEKPLVAHSFIFTRKQASKQEEEEEDKEEEETLLERALLLLRKSSIATTCLSRERDGSLFCVFEEFWQKESKEKISFSPV